MTLDDLKFGKGFDFWHAPMDSTIADAVRKGTSMPSLDELLIKRAYGVRSVDLRSQYVKTLVDKGLAMSRGQVKAFNLIDLREFFFGSLEDARTKVEFGDFPVGEILTALDVAMSSIDKEKVLGEYGICLSIPCFEQGTLWISQNQFTYWRVQEINLKEQYVRIFIKRYLVTKNNEWFPLEEGNVEIYAENGEPMYIMDGDKMERHEIPFAVRVLDYKPATEIFTSLDPATDLHWGVDYQRVYNSTVVTWEISEEFEARSKGTSAFSTMATLFAQAIFIINIRLYLEKPKAVRTKSSKVTAEACDKKDLNKSKVLTRYVGSIRIKSEKVPKLPTKETVVKYKTPVWHARGGVRHLQDGRVIPFKESTRRRKCLMEKYPEQNFDTPQSVINIKKDGEE